MLTEPDRVVPFFDEHDIRLSRMLTDRGTEYCGSPERHEYELYLAIEDIDHTRTKTKSPQTNGICERFHRTVLDEFYRVAFRKKIRSYVNAVHLNENPVHLSSAVDKSASVSMPRKVPWADLERYVNRIVAKPRLVLET